MDHSPECLQASPQAAASLEAGSLPCDSQAQQGVIYLLLSMAVAAFPGARAIYRWEQLSSLAGEPQAQHQLSASK